MKQNNEITITNDTYQCLKHKTRENKKYLINNKNKSKKKYIYTIYIKKKGFFVDANRVSLFILFLNNPKSTAFVVMPKYVKDICR